MISADGLIAKVRLRHLRCFVAVAKTGSFVQAADELGITQPAISRSIRELETILSTKLFERSTRGATLTSRGRALFASTEMGLLQIAQGVSLATDSASLSETVKIGALPNVCSRLLPSVVPLYKERYPTIIIRVVPGTNAELLMGLRRGETDFVIGRLSTSEEMRRLSFEHLFDEPIVFVVGADHPLAAKYTTLNDALSYPVVLPTEGTIIREEISRYLWSQGVGTLTNVVETTSSDFLRSYVKETDCVAVMPRGVVQAEIDRGEFCVLPIAHPVLSGPVGLTTNPEAPRRHSVAKLLQIIRDRALYI